jgi:hypothetical protein
MGGGYEDTPTIDSCRPTFHRDVCLVQARYASAIGVNPRQLVGQ